MVKLMEFPLQAVLVFVTLILFYNVWVSKTNTKTRKSSIVRTREAPEPAGAWPIIGHLRLLGRRENLGRVLGAIADEYGPAFTLRLGRRRMLVVTSPELVRDCFATNDVALATHRTDTAAAEYMGYGGAMMGFAPYGPYWRDIRKITTLELLSNARIELLKHVRISEIDLAVKELYGIWRKNSERPVEVDMTKWLGELLFNVILRMVAGKRYFGGTGMDPGEVEVADRVTKLTEEFFVLLGTTVPSDVLPFLKWFDIGGHEKAMKRVAGEMDAVLDVWLEVHRRRRIAAGGGDGDHDFIDVLLSISENGRLPCSTFDSETVLKATILNMILGGTDTGALSLSWTLSLLLNNRDALRKAQDEIDTHVGKSRNVDESDIRNLPYLQAVIKESFRLYPPVPVLLPHEATEDCTIGGYHVPAGTLMTVNVWKLHRDPRVWSPDPSEFRPERFLGAEVDVRGGDFELIPFASGRRACPAISLALQFVHLTLARLLQGFEMGTPTDAPVDMSEGHGAILPRATPLVVVLSPRLLSELYC